MDFILQFLTIKGRGVYRKEMMKILVSPKSSCTRWVDFWCKGSEGTTIHTSILLINLHSFCLHKLKTRERWKIGKNDDLVLGSLAPALGISCFDFCRWEIPYV